MKRSRVAFWFGAFILFPLLVIAAVRVYQARCPNPYFWKIKADLLKGQNDCTAFDLNHLTSREGRIVSFNEEAKLYDNARAGTAVLQVWADFIVSELRQINPPEPVYYRIDYRKPIKIEKLPGMPEGARPIDTSRTAQPFVAARGLGQMTRLNPGHPLAWLFPSYRWAGYHSEDSFQYPAAGGEPVSAYHSPGGEFLVMTSEAVTNQNMSDTYIEIFRRRDHGSLALLRTSCCGVAPTYTDRNHGWVNNRDFFWVTGNEFSQVLACRFEP